jgi:hypothetical protein
LVSNPLLRGILQPHHLPQVVGLQVVGQYFCPPDFSMKTILNCRIRVKSFMDISKTGASIYRFRRVVLFCGISSNSNSRRPLRGRYFLICLPHFFCNL